jgi:dTMP kinase
MSRRRGKFITLEGVDGAGKSTHVQWLAEAMAARGLTVVTTREPGGTPLAEQLRTLLLTQPMSLKTETLLMFAARDEHLRQTIVPALRSGAWVLCDRFTDATYAYQGGGREVGPQDIAMLERYVHPDLQPDRTWLFDVPLEVARERLAGARDPDRFEQETSAFFERVRAAYHVRAREQPARIKVIDATRSIALIRRQLEADLDALVSEAGA